MIFGILITLSVIVNIALFYVVKGLAERSMQYDAALNNIVEDLDIFIDYADSLLEKKIFSMSPEIITFTQNLRDMRKRLEDHVTLYFYANARQRKKKVKQTTTNSLQQ